MAQDTKNFKVSEFACKCGCGFDKIDQRVMNMAQALRDELGVPVRVNSGCRCEKHNADPKVGGVKGSKHTKGLAADLSCSKGNKALWNAAKKLYSEGKLPDLDFCRIRGYKSWIHIDCGGQRNNRWDG